VPALIALWSIVSAMTSLVKDYKSILLVRFFLGVCIIIIFMWVGDKALFGNGTKLGFFFFF
jgi:hypothetical protein